MAVVKTNPMKLVGPWTTGYVLDYHSISAVPTGDPYHPFDIKRTELGELVYRLKYAGDQNAIVDIVDTVADFIGSHNPGITKLVPAPPSLKRPAQPVVVIAAQLAIRLNIDILEHAIEKVKDTPSMKNVQDWFERQRLLADSIKLGADNVTGHSILLFDDLTQSGATLGRTAEVLLKDGNAKAVHVLTLTRTR